MALARSADSAELAEEEHSAAANPTREIAKVLVNLDWITPLRLLALKSRGYALVWIHETGTAGYTAAQICQWLRRCGVPTFAHDFIHDHYVFAIYAQRIGRAQYLLRRLGVTVAQVK